MPHGGALPNCVIAHMLQFCGPDTVLKVACTGAWRWHTSSPEVQRQVIAARRLCAIAVSIRDSDSWSPQLRPSEFRGCRYIALVLLAAVFMRKRAIADEPIVCAVIGYVSSQPSKYGNSNILGAATNVMCTLLNKLGCVLLQLPHQVFFVERISTRRNKKHTH